MTDCLMGIGQYQRQSIGLIVGLVVSGSRAIAQASTTPIFLSLNMAGDLVDSQCKVFFDTQTGPLAFYSPT